MPNIRPYTRKANYYETDQMGIIHHANYIHWFEEARVDLMEQAGFSYQQAAARGIDFALVGIGCEYKSMVRFGDVLEIRAAITKMTPSRLTVRYRVLDAATREVRATGHSEHCFFHRESQRPVSLKKALPELHTLFTGLCAEGGEV